MWVLLAGLLGGWVSWQIPVSNALGLAVAISFSLFVWCFILERRIAAVRAADEDASAQIAGLEARIKSLEASVRSSQRSEAPSLGPWDAPPLRHSR